MAISALVAAVSTGVAVGTAAIAGTAFTFLGLTGFAAVAASFAVGTALGAAMNAMAPKPSMASTRGFSIAGESGAALDHQIIYGERRVGGARIYDASTGEENRFLHRILAFAGHEIDGYSSIYLNDEIVTVDPSTGMVTEPERYAGKVRIKRYLGTSDQTADADLITETAGLTDGEWTSAHRLRGIAYLYIRFEYGQDTYPNGIPAVSAVVRGRKVYDPRKDSTAPQYNPSLGVSTHRADNPSTWQYSSNSALCTRDYIVADFGMRQPNYRVNDDSVAASADVCAQVVEGEARYSCDGAFLTSVEPGVALRDLSSSMAGIAWYTGGMWNMRPGSWSAPVASFDENDIRGGISVATRHSRRENFNSVRGIFGGPETEWEFTDYPVVRDVTAATAIVAGASYTISSVGNTNFVAIGAASNTVGVTFVATGAGTGTGTVDAFLGADYGLSNEMDLPLKFTTSSLRCQRLARLFLRRNREQLTVSVNLSLRGFALTVGDVIQLSNVRFGWTNKTFEVVDWGFGVSEDMTLYVAATLREISEAVFADTSGAVLELNNTTLPSPFRSTSPTTLTLTTLTGFASDGALVTSISASWPASSDRYVTSYEIQWRKSTDTDFFSATVNELDYAISGVLNDTTYDVRVRAINIYGFRGAFVVDSILVGQDVTPPALPSDFTATGAFGYIRLSWTNPADLDFSNVQVWESATNNSATATQIASAFGSTFLRGNLDSGVTRYFWLKSVDRSGNVSGFSAGVQGTTAFVDDTDFEDGVINLFLDQSLGPIPSGSTFPSSPSDGDQFFHTTDGQLYVYVAASDRWELRVEPGSIVASDKIVANTITGGLLAASGIITDSAQMNDAVIVSAKIQNLAVERIKIGANAVSEVNTAEISLNYTASQQNPNTEIVSFPSPTLENITTECFFAFVFDAITNPAPHIGYLPINGWMEVRLQIQANFITSFPTSFFNVGPVFSAQVTKPNLSMLNKPLLTGSVFLTPLNTKADTAFRARIATAVYDSSGALLGTSGKVDGVMFTRLLAK